MKLSVVTTMYFSSPYLEEFYKRVRTTVEQLTSDYEIIFVNDGSPDDSLQVALALFATDPHIKVVDLSRNFGHHKAIMTGLAYATGDWVFLIDCDLEEEPELLLRFYEVIDQESADVVYGVQEKRKGGILEQISGNIFYMLFNFLSHQKVPQNVVTARLMSKRYVESLIQHQDHEVFLLGLWTITGYKQVPVVVTKYSKRSSTYNFARKLAIFINSITSFSNRPLVLIFYLGVLISFLSGGAAAYLIVRRLFFGELLAGWPSLIVSVWLLGGLTILCLGVIGIYLAKIFSETKRRPYTIVRHLYSHEGLASNANLFIQTHSLIQSHLSSSTKATE